MVAKVKNGTLFALLFSLLLGVAITDAAEKIKLDRWAKILADGKANTLRRLEAAKRLGEAKDPKVLGVLTRALKDDKKAIRWAAAQALWDLGDKRAVPSLIEYLDKAETYQWGKILTMNALGSLGGSKAVDSLLKKLNSENPFLRRTAALALVRIGDKKAIPGLIGLLRDEQGWLRRLAQALLLELTKEKILGAPPRGI